MASVASIPSMNTVQALRLHAASVLAESGMAMDEAQREARMLMELATGMNVTRQVAMGEMELTAAQQTALEALTARRAKREPMAYLAGKKEFFGMDFLTSHATLIPRPDSEILVETALALLPETVHGQMLDLGTGTGCLLLSVLKHRMNMHGVGVDLQREALAICARNAMQHEVADRVTWHVGSWFAALPMQHTRFDMILANPPYISTADMAELMVDVRDYEPHTALHGGADGLDDYRAIIARADHHLQPGGVLIFEVGHTQAADVAALGVAAGFTHKATKQDLAGHARVVVLQAGNTHSTISFDSI